MTRSYESWHRLQAEAAKSMLHEINDPNAPFCNCGQDTFLCQSCAKVFCGSEYGGWVDRNKVGGFVHGSVCKECWHA